MALHTLFLPEHDLSLDELTVEGEEASHASRVKRVGEGDMVRILSGRGDVLIARVLESRRTLRLRVEERRQEPPLRPRVEVFSATPKGARLDEMIDQLGQVGAAVWFPMETALGVVDPREHKLDRAGRIARESAKQCGRAWVMEIGTKTSFAQAVKAPQGVAVILADGSGERFKRPTEETVRLLVGPEGGFTREEVDHARASGAALASFGPHIMRIETAAVVATALIMAATES